MLLFYFSSAFIFVVLYSTSKFARVRTFKVFDNVQHEDTRVTQLMDHVLERFSIIKIQIDLQNRQKYA